MTDEELIARLRDGKLTWGDRWAAANRIEALKQISAAGELAARELRILEGEYDTVLAGRADEHDRAERLEEVLQAILHTAHADDHVGWQTALEDARAALKGADYG